MAHTHSRTQTCTCRIRDDNKRKPFDDEYIFGLVWQQKAKIVLAAACLVVCTTSNLAAPVLTGMLMELLVQQKPVEDYVRVRRGKGRKEE